jgi:hypothetical protein
MAAVRAVIRYSFTETEDGGRRTTALITASLQSKTEQSALNFVLKKYPERHNIEIIEVLFNDF